jgi:serine/threonine protein kinase
VRRGEYHKADLTVYDLGSERVLLKDYSRKRGFWRHVVGTLLTHRETAALRALDGIPHVPQFRGKPDRYSVAMTYEQSTSLHQCNLPAAQRERLARDLERFVQQMHRRGVVHLDLMHRSNVMFTESGRLIVLDFESASTFPADTLFGRLAVALLGLADRLAVAQWKRRLCPAALEAKERRTLTLYRRIKKYYLPRRIVDFFLDPEARHTASATPPRAGDRHVR